MQFEMFLNDLIASKLEAVEMSFVAKILTFNKAKMTASIRPMLFGAFSASESEKPTVVNVPDMQNIPVELLYAGGAYIRPDYKNGDLVRVSCYASAVSPVINGGVRSNSKALRFQLNSCTVSCGLVPKSATVPSTWAEKSGLLIGKGDVCISFDEQSVVIDGNLNVDGNITATGDIEATGDVKAGPISLLNHTHTSGTAASPTSPPLPGP